MNLWLTRGIWRGTVILMTEKLDKQASDYVADSVALWLQEFPQTEAFEDADLINFIRSLGED